jgi:hypothetical protein
VLLAPFVVLAVTIGEASLGVGQSSLSLGWQASLLYLALVLLYYCISCRRSRMPSAAKPSPCSASSMP